MENEKTVKEKTVQEKNASWLANQTKMTGFGETNEAEILEKIKSGIPEFSVKVFREFKFDNDLPPDVTESNLHISMGKKEYYHFNKYDTRIITRPLDPIASMVEMVNVDGKFPQNTFTLKEIYNQKLNGSVEKEISYEQKNKLTGEIELDEHGEKIVLSFKTWKKANHRQLNDKGVYPKMSFKFSNWEAILQKYPIKELLDPERREAILRGLRKGNAVLVTLTSGQTELKRHIEIDAELKTIRVSEQNPRLYNAEKFKLNQQIEATKTDLNEEGKGESHKVAEENILKKKESHKLNGRTSVAKSNNKSQPTKSAKRKSTGMVRK
ncbi:hypothetical protein [Chitinophaga sp. MM2321]|uniref:hypothetical protein n=1 Tax=Chitinophaga sp. MM2321 TaxID=3137178 RepID=UPI0032D5AFB1